MERTASPGRDEHEARSSEARRRAVNLPQPLELMREIERYNEVDCRVMWEVISYLRNHH
jgi:predicted RecB family nuclease